MKKPKRLTALVLAGALLGSSITTVPANAKTFSDVPSNHWAYNVINEISDKTIMIGVGDGVFSPNTQLTRAEYTAILFNLAPDKSDGMNYIAHMTDVPADAWYKDAAKWGITIGIIAEKDGRFDGNAVASRELMASMTAKYITTYYPDSLKYDYSSPGYKDEAKIGSEYLQAVNFLTNNGVLVGRGNTNFYPQDSLTRAEAAAMASRVMDVAKKAGEETPTNPGDKPTDPEEPSYPSEPEQPTGPDEPSQPSEPEQPTDPNGPNQPSEPEKPSVDPADPTNWDLDGAPEWFLIGQPDYLTTDQWQDLIQYWKDKERPSEYPAQLPAGVKNEEQAWRELNYYVERLYDLMQRGKAAEALIEGENSLSDKEMAMVNSVNQLRRDNNQAELKISPALCEAAQIRAKEALTSEAHKRPDGSSFMTVLHDVNLEYYKLNSDTNSVYLAENQTRGIRDPKYDVNLAMTNFTNSQAHKKNMLSPIHQYIGIGYYSNGKDSAWVQIFGRLQ